MSEVIGLCTCGSDEEASRIANALVEARLAACVNILPPIRSIYRWQGQIETAAEVLLLIKTTEERFSALQQRIRDLHSYKTPEIIAVPIVAGLEKYLTWVREQV
jgi:periplasmic divalent cation tolerance protein